MSPGRSGELHRYPYLGKEYGAAIAAVEMALDRLTVVGIERIVEIVGDELDHFDTAQC